MTSKVQERYRNRAGKAAHRLSASGRVPRTIVVLSAHVVTESTVLLILVPDRVSVPSGFLAFVPDWISAPGGFPRLVADQQGIEAGENEERRRFDGHQAAEDRPSERGVRFTATFQSKGAGSHREEGRHRRHGHRLDPDRRGFANRLQRS